MYKTKAKLKEWQCTDCAHAELFGACTVAFDGRDYDPPTTCPCGNEDSCKWMLLEIDAHPPAIESDSPFLKAVDQLIHLHMCEQEGIDSGMPTSEQWQKAVDDLGEEREKLRKNEKISEKIESDSVCELPNTRSVHHHVESDIKSNVPCESYSAGQDCMCETMGKCENKACLISKVKG